MHAFPYLLTVLLSWPSMACPTALSYWAQTMFQDFLPNPLIQLHSEDEYQEKKGWGELLFLNFNTLTHGYSFHFPYLDIFLLSTQHRVTRFNKCLFGAAIKRYRFQDHWEEFQISAPSHALWQPWTSYSDDQILCVFMANGEAKEQIFQCFCEASVQQGESSNFENK